MECTSEELVWWLNYYFWKLVHRRATIILFLYFFVQFFFYPYLMEGLSHYIEFSKPFPSYTCSSSNHALKYMSYRASSLALCERYWLKTLFRGLLHINAARKTVAVYLMRWWQLFPKIFLYPYHLHTRLKSIFIVGISWKIIQVNRMPAWLIFVKSEEDDPLGPRPSTHPNATIYSRTFPVVCSSSDVFPLANGAWGLI